MHSSGMAKTRLGHGWVFSRIFQRKISANRLAMVGMAGGWAGAIRFKFWLKFCFLTITQMFLNGMD